MNPCHEQLKLSRTYPQHGTVIVQIHQSEHCEAACVGLIEFPGSDQRHLGHVAHSSEMSLNGRWAGDRYLAGKIIDMYARLQGDFR